jgi:ubiquinone/menaquinone biosynthesis C-methylase UbiE
LDAQSSRDRIAYRREESAASANVNQLPQTYEPFAEESAYIGVNGKLVDRVFNRLNGRNPIRLLDIAAGTGLLTSLLYEKAKADGSKVISTLLDLDFPALSRARRQVHADRADAVFASADFLPLREVYDAVIFANALHLLDAEAKELALAESWRVLKPGGLLAMNSTFYEGAYPEESKHFYSRWIRRAIAEINRRLPERSKGEKGQAMEWLSAEGYRGIIANAGFKIVEMRERRVRLSQAAVRAISSYKEFAKGALHATDGDAEEAARALEATVQQTFRDLKMKYLPRLWLEIVAEKP